MTQQNLFLGIDCGTQGTKAIVLDASSGKVLGLGAAAHTLISGANGRREQHTQEWLDAFTEATHRALQQAGVDGQDILGIGVSGQQHGLVLLDDQGQVLRPAKLWCDTETAPENDRLLQHLGGESGSLERLGVAIAPGYTVSKLLWTREQHPDIFKQIAHILLPHDYLNYWLTGRAVAEYGDASGTGYFNVRSRDWDVALLKHIDPSGRLEQALPQLIEADQTVGSILPAIAERLGINPNAIVASGGGDNMMGAIGTGNIAPGVITMSLGSSGTVYAFSDQPNVSPPSVGRHILLIQRRLVAIDLHDEPDQRHRRDTRALRTGPERLQRPGGASADWRRRRQHAAVPQRRTRTRPAPRHWQPARPDHDQPDTRQPVPRRG